MDKVLEQFLTKYGGTAWKDFTFEQMKEDLNASLASAEVHGPEIVLVNSLKRKIKKMTDKKELLLLVADQIFGED